MEVVQTGVEAPGEWITAGAGQLEMRGVVTSGDLAAVLSGTDPSSGASLGRWHDRVKVAGFDLTFCAPKSVSILHALGGPDVSSEVREGHQEAVSTAVSYVEHHALAVRRNSGGERRLYDAQAVAGAGFVHRVSRALDPHLHSHVVVANLARAPDGTWSALDGRGIYAHLSAAGAFYHAQLRHELSRRLGVEWGPLDRGRADVAGISREARSAFSRRARAIEAHLAERGLAPTVPARASDHGRPPNAQGRAAAMSEVEAGALRAPSRRAQQMASLITRAPRDPTLSAEALRPEWERRALEVGLSPRRLEMTLGRVSERALTEEVSTERTVEQLDALLCGLDRSVARRDVFRAVCSSLPRGGAASTIDATARNYLESLRPIDGPAGRRDAPGVGERRHLVEARALEERMSERRDCERDPEAQLERRATSERGRIQRLLAARGMSEAAERLREVEKEPGLGLGW
jgi:conjugative relaxase-like TrwC/TraI family protein